MTTKKLKGAQYPSLSNPYCNNPTPDPSLVKKDTKATIMPDLSFRELQPKKVKEEQKKRRSVASIYTIYAKKSPFTKAHLQFGKMADHNAFAEK